MGWDHEYQVDANGVPSGPYEAWQVVGSALTMLVAMITAALMLERRVAILAPTIGYAAAWAVTEMPDDESGTSGVGLVMVAIGVSFAAAVVTAIVGRARERLAQTRRRP
jgi:hypothetical protein